MTQTVALISAAAQASAPGYDGVPWGQVAGKTDTGPGYGWRPSKTQREREREREHACVCVCGVGGWVGGVGVHVLVCFCACVGQEVLLCAFFWGGGGGGWGGEVFRGFTQGKVTWCFMHSQPLWLHQVNRFYTNIVFISALLHCAQWKQ